MLRGAVLGCGRIGAGIGWQNTFPYIYDHCSTYNALKDRISLEWVFDKDLDRARDARDRHAPFVMGGGLLWRHALESMMEKWPVDVVSICVRPEDQAELAEELAKYDCIKAAWIEKPFMLKTWPNWKINISYIRRFDAAHQRRAWKNPSLWVKAKMDIHTVCHFTDLARYWGIPRHRFHYETFNGPNSYRLVHDDGVHDFLNGGVVGGFMEAALTNLLDAIEGKADLISPPENAIESEKWANEILKGTA